MGRHINRESKKILDRFMCEDPDCESIFVDSDGRTHTRIFAHSRDSRAMIGWLELKGLDAFKRGTKEPARIAEALLNIKWKDIKDTEPAKNLITFADRF